MLETLNVWVDTAGFVIAAGMVLGLIIPSFIASVLTGRVKKHFVDDYWDSLAHRMHDPKQYHYKQPISPDFAAPVRVWHWVNLVAWLLLLISGLYIRYPWFAGGRELMRSIHYFFMYLIVVVLILRLIYLWYAKNWRDYLTFDMVDLPWALSVARYYTYTGPPYDHFKKFNPLQRPAYPLIWIMLIVQAITGFIMWRPGLAGPLAGIFGGPADTAGWMRLFHNIDMRMMVALVTVHSFLGAMEDWPVLKVFWFWKEPDLEKYEHEDHGAGAHAEAGHGEPEEAPAHQ